MSSERKVELLNRSAQNAEDEALKLIRIKYEEPRSDNRLQFHMSEHSRLIIKRTQLILWAVGQTSPSLVTMRDMTLGQIAAAFHDTVQIWDEDKTVEAPDFTKIRMKRHIVENETLSSSVAQAFMERVNRTTRQELFSPDDFSEVNSAILATIPGFDPGLGTVIQPYLNKDSSIVTRAVALADIGSAGMDTARYLLDGNTLFREENIDVIRSLVNEEPISRVQKESIRERALGWSAVQIKFSQGRQVRMDQELEGLSRDVKTAINSIFNSFDDTQAAALRVLKKRERMSFGELLIDLGYPDDSRSRLIKPVHFN